MKKKATHKLAKSFSYAFEGLEKGFKERNMRIHGIVSVIVVMLGIVFQIENEQWALLLVAIGLVWMAELLNTAVEVICDIVRDELKLDYKATKHPRDLAAAAVLVAAIVAGLIGVIVFLPYLI